MWPIIEDIKHTQITNPHIGLTYVYLQLIDANIGINKSNINRTIQHILKEQQTRHIQLTCTRLLYQSIAMNKSKK